MKSDPNKGHFKKNADWDKVDWDGMDPELKKEFIDFLVSRPAPPNSRAACCTRR
jgi:magnesium-protoporphyrin IX monomethyl ester (oxidative) cyclase